MYIYIYIYNCRLSQLVCYSNITGRLDAPLKKKTKFLQEGPRNREPGAHNRELRAQNREPRASLGLIIDSLVLRIESLGLRIESPGLRIERAQGNPDKENSRISWRTLLNNKGFEHPESPGQSRQGKHSVFLQNFINNPGHNSMLGALAVNPPGGIINNCSLRPYD